MPQGYDRPPRGGAEPEGEVLSGELIAGSHQLVEDVVHDLADERVRRLLRRHDDQRLAALDLDHRAWLLPVAGAFTAMPARVAALVVVVNRTLPVPLMVIG